ncbi:response regulator [Mitsuaria sp. WAJ17]|uniref:response regulator n=1 Tax=Mitsuaria sp. WAJ17 TaxID=2761452 RepID=UPI0015FFC5CE|nr:response regulator [Mitsuaria sp. WAJ17]MBB2486472.1 response regulator [Mitsuaria sp. WAJ17]
MVELNPTPLRVLIVDDSRAIQAIIARVLQNAGLGPMVVETASNGEQALRMVTAQPPDLVISDWHMPVVSGIEMLQTLRQLGGGMVKVGFVTTETAERHLDQARSNGAVFVINKPFKDEQLLQEVQKALAARVEQLRAPPPPPPPPAPPPALASEGALNALIKQQLGQIPFRLVPAPNQSLEDLKLPHDLAMYALDGEKTPFALGLLDVNACCILGGGGARMQPPLVRQAMQVGKPTSEMMQFADHFLRSAAAILTPAEGGRAPTLRIVNLMPKPFDKLQGLLLRNRGRSDYRIAVPGYGEGRLVFIRC